MGFQGHFVNFPFQAHFGLLTVLKLPFFRLIRQDVKSLQIFGKEKLQSNYGQKNYHESDSSASGVFISCLGGCIMGAVVAAPCGLQSLLTQRRVTPHPLQEICHLKPQDTGEPLRLRDSSKHLQASYYLICGQNAKKR